MLPLDSSVERKDREPPSAATLGVLSTRGPLIFKWYHIEPDGTASIHEDNPSVCARINRGEPGWYASPEGAILHGGVKATAFNRWTEITYNAAAWLATGAMIEAGIRTTTTITAEPKL